MLIYKILKKSALGYLHSIFEYAVNITGCSSRNPHRLLIPIMEGVVYTTEEQLYGML